ncbi:hypothetical protein F2Q69_00025068 [Brassica cretica]|uniref:Uncharacterized protein n=1 Tax=Brassica cretica TaxID=69181 RepID=A0A8S9QG22_BRACR|nr:hypothetical protein F2Q69_00025068 [Brassica cretica]
MRHMERGRGNEERLELYCYFVGLNRWLQPHQAFSPRLSGLFREHQTAMPYLSSPHPSLESTSSSWVF